MIDRVGRRHPNAGGSILRKRTATRSSRTPSPCAIRRSMEVVTRTPEGNEGPHWPGRRARIWTSGRRFFKATLDHRREFAHTVLHLFAPVVDCYTEVPALEAHQHAPQLLARYFPTVDNEQRNSAVLRFIPFDSAAHRLAGNLRAVLATHEMLYGQTSAHPLDQPAEQRQSAIERAARDYILGMRKGGSCDRGAFVSFDTDVSTPGLAPSFGGAFF